MIILTEEEFNNLFTKYPQVRKAEAGKPCCPYCGNAFSPENLTYYNTSTEAGTPCCGIEITCDVCNKAIWRGGSWYPSIDDNEELLEVAEIALDRELG
jgi:hypothetical protein